MRTLAIPALVLCALVLAACGSSETEQTEPTFEQAKAIAEEQLAGSGCEFKTEDESSEDLEQKGLDCYLTEDGEETYSSVFTYTRDLESDETDELIPGLTTADHVFVNGNIEVDPAGGDPTAVQLDSEEFTTGLEAQCGCGEVQTPTE